MTQRTLSELIDRRGAEPAVIYGERVLSYGDLAARSRRLARGLADLGIGAGDRVAFWLPNTPDYLALLVACARLGAITVAVNTRFREAEVGDIVGRSGARALVLWPSFLGIPFLDILASIDRVQLAGVETLILYGEPGDPAPRVLPDVGRRSVAVAALAERPAMRATGPADNSGCAIFTTSGTTRAPKFVLHGQHGVATHAVDVARACGYDRPGTAGLLAVPLCGVFGFSQALATLAGGGVMIMTPTFEAEVAARLIHRHQVTHTNGGDDMVGRLLDAMPGERPFPSLDGIGYAAFNSALADLPVRAERRGLRLFGLYGMSEVLALFARQPLALPVELRSRAGGIPVARVARVRARDPESGKVLEHGEAGELEVRGPSLMLSYFGDPAATKAAFTEDGFLRTGDLGYTEDDGGFVFLARIGDVLRLGGFLVAPAEIESTLLEVPGIADAQTVAVATPAGTRPVAFVIVRPGATLDEAAAIAHCRARIAKYKVPARIVCLDAFPVTQSANCTKIQRAKLRAMAEEAMRRQAG